MKEEENPIAEAMEKMGVKSWLLFAWQAPTALVYSRSKDTTVIRCVMKAFIEDDVLRGTFRSLIEDIDTGRLSSVPTQHGKA